jgi:predicted O-linked N-acetylglucosamine transferase (SPINDLY family)
MTTHPDQPQRASQTPRYYNKQGLALAAHGRLDSAIDAFKQAVYLNPGYAEAYFNLAFASCTLGDFGTAIENYKHCLRINPDDVATCYNLANTLLKINDIDAAIGVYKNVLRLEPHHSQTFHNLGIAFKKCAKPAEAIQNFKRAIEIEPDHTQAHNSLGTLYLELKRPAKAITTFQRYLQLQPDDPAALNNLGNAYYQQGQLTEAIACYRKSLQLNPENAQTNYNLANALQETDKTDEAVQLYQYALSREPNWPEAYNNLGTVYQNMGLLDKAIAGFEKALDIQPNYAEALNNLGIVYRHQGRIPAAISCYRKALRIKPEYSECHSNFVFGLNYDPNATQEDIFKHACQWWTQHGRPITGGFVHANSRDPNRRLKIGYVSADFRRHPVGFFFLPLLKAHDRNTFEAFCYTDIKQPDELTEQIKSSANHWTPTVGLSDAEVAEKIYTDRIDILIDLAGHTANNRLLVFARKPAPLQVNWLGYVNTTGLATMDYRITDGIVDPVTENNRYHSEIIIRLENSFFCFAPPPKSPPLGELPARKHGYITFGSFNKLSKINKEVIALWSQIMHRLPGSRLRLMARPLADALTRDSYLSRFQANGIPSNRIEMITYTPSYYDYLNQYSQIDISLDPFPHNGHTTTCDSLWMGVPVITWSGDRYASRMGASVLTRLQLEGFVAGTKEAYFQKAVRLAADWDTLQELRNGMRKRFTSSPLYDAQRFAREMEITYREIWRKWCRGGD